ncbi:MAG: flagellar hook-basal body complex protein FliE [Candidatus Eremiobacteraeota bacterium]|nr:flagellar hook-basal body complex protein FliE [Candidatus Eremiobacteraeota bacterium]
MSKVVPGTFVPDIAPNLAPTTEPIPGGAPGALPGVGAPGESATSFKDTVKGLMDDVNTKMTTSDQLSRDFASGKTNDLNKVVTSVEEANLSMNFTLAMRNKLLEAYQEIERMQV